MTGLFALLAQASPVTAETITPGLSALFGALGPTAGVVVVVIYFLNRDKEREKDNREFHNSLLSRVELIEANNREALNDAVDKFAASVAESREEQRQTVQTLLGINKDTVAATVTVSTRLADNNVQVAQLGAKVETLGAAVNELRHSIDRKADKPH